jgi:hypothetical protein
VIAGLTQPQLISLAMVLAGGAWLATHWGPAHPAPAVTAPPARTRTARQRA